MYNSKHNCQTWQLNLRLRERNALSLFWCQISCCFMKHSFGVKIFQHFQQLAEPMFLTPCYCCIRQKWKDLGVVLPWARLCPRTVCWWCRHCLPTWSDKSCSTWEAKAAPEASRPVSLAAEDKVLMLTHLKSNYNQWAMFPRIHLVTLEWPWNCC